MTDGNRARRLQESALDADAPGLDGQTRRRLQSRRRLLDAARELFVEHGYDRTRPQDIARHAGVATGTFYLHFRDKEDVFLAFADEAQAHLLDECRERLAHVHGVTERIRVFIRAMFDHAERHPGVLQVAFLDPVMIAPGDEDAWRLYDRFGRIFAEGLEEAVAQDLIHDDYDLDLVSHALGGLMRHGTIFGGRRDMDPELVADQLTRFIGRGLGADLHAPDGRDSNA
ncbi:MAG TPA: TetR/AcrR family transcriptional regulator [Pseudomonadales bacterium]|nr:TetR/AcrR family transcriptional regulator [Pseudomonadales bacterium]